MVSNATKSIGNKYEFPIITDNLFNYLLIYLSIYLVAEVIITQVKFFQVCEV